MYIYIYIACIDGQSRISAMSSEVLAPVRNARNKNELFRKTWIPDFFSRMPQDANFVFPIINDPIRPI